MPDTQKAYVNKKNAAVLKCPACASIREIPVERFKGTKHIIKVKCTCGQIYSVHLEFRKSYRKEIKLSADFIYLPQRRSGGKMLILNISKTGLGGNVIGGHKMQVGLVLQVKFNLNDKNNSEIDKKVVVRLVRGSYIGCQFVEPSHHDKAIGFYLLP